MKRHVPSRIAANRAAKDRAYQRALADMAQRHDARRDQAEATRAQTQPEAPEPAPVFDLLPIWAMD
jgi:hypothetical protein